MSFDEWFVAEISEKRHLKTKRELFLFDNQEASAFKTTLAVWNQDDKLYVAQFNSFNNTSLGRVGKCHPEGDRPIAIVSANRC